MATAMAAVFVSASASAFSDHGACISRIVHAVLIG
jgi:hypothetical protein